MSSFSRKKHPNLVADRVLRRAGVSKIARKLQGRLRLARFKTRHGWEDLTLDAIEPKVEEQRHRKRQDSSGKRLRTSPALLGNEPFHALDPDRKNRAGAGAGVRTGAGIAHYHQLAQSSPLEPSRRQHFTTAAGPSVLLFQMPWSASVKELTSSGPSAVAASMTTSFVTTHDGEEEDGLLLYLAQSPSPAVSGNKPNTVMEPPSTPPPRSLALPSSMMMTPGDGNLFPTTPGQSLDFSEFLKFTPSLAPRTFKTPGTLSSTRDYR